MPKLRADHLSMKSPEFDLWLELFDLIREPDRCYSMRELADYMGCSHQVIHYYEKRALKKLQKQAGALMERRPLYRPSRRGKKTFMTTNPSPKEVR